MTLALHEHRWLPATVPGLPTLVLLHGTGGNETSLLDIGAELWPGAARLSPRGRVLEHGLPRYFRRFAEGEFDLEDLALRTEEVGTWLQTARRAYQVTESPMVLVGYSNGANMAASLLLAGVRADIAVLLRPMFVHRPAALASLAGTRVRVASGARDQITPAASATRLSELLRECGASVEQMIQPNASHGLQHVEIVEAARWLQHRPRAS